MRGASEVTYGNRTITSERFNNARFALGRMILDKKASPLTKSINVGGVTADVDDMEMVLTLAGGMFFRLSQEQGE